MKSVALIYFAFCTVVVTAQQSTQVAAGYLHRAQQSLTDVIVHDVFSPPAASRIYMYSNIAVYETLVLFSDDHNTLAKHIEGFPQISKGELRDDEIFPTLAALSAFLHTSGNFVFSEKRMADSTNKLLNEFSRLFSNKKKINRSIEFGKRIGDSILRYSAKDHYRETRSLRRFTINSSDGRWIPTPPAYMAAVEPHWGKIRPVVMDSAAQFRPPLPLEYGIDSNGKFYRQAYEVYDVVKRLSSDQRNIALFWDCNPFFMNTSGHLMFATKKLSPGGHWMSIARVASEKSGADMMQAATAYTFTAMALFDGFISCWDEKYRSNYIRPETFINSRIDESWRPLLQTPPFPEYTSGHSVISSAAAVVLTSLFGDQFSFEDDSEVAYGLPVRSFSSFGEAANEAAISRLYGGIHFREAIEHGQVQGKKLGSYIVEKLEVRKLSFK